MGLIQQRLGKIIPILKGGTGANRRSGEGEWDGDSSHRISGGVDGDEKAASSVATRDIRDDESSSAQHAKYATCDLGSGMTHHQRS